MDLDEIFYRKLTRHIKYSIENDDRTEEISLLIFDNLLMFHEMTPSFRKWLLYSVGILIFEIFNWEILIVFDVYNWFESLCDWLSISQWNKIIEIVIGCTMK